MGLFKDCGCGCNGKKQQGKFTISLMSALLFFIIANPDTFRLMRSILGSWVSGPNGCPTMAGLILHTIVFMLIAWGMMNIKRETYAPYEPEMASVKMSPLETPTLNGASSMQMQMQMPKQMPKQMPMGPYPMQMQMPMQMPMDEPIPRMVDMPLPQPGMTEKSYNMSDSGSMFAPIDINDDMDLPYVRNMGGAKAMQGAVTCACSDGRNVVITP